MTNFPIYRNKFTSKFKLYFSRAFFKAHKKVSTRIKSIPFSNGFEFSVSGCSYLRGTTGCNLSLRICVNKAPVIVETMVTLENTEMAFSMRSEVSPASERTPWMTVASETNLIGSGMTLKNGTIVKIEVTFEYPTNPSFLTVLWKRLPSLFQIRRNRRRAERWKEEDRVPIIADEAEDAIDEIW